jgi:hypothetical protein
VTEQVIVGEIEAGAAAKARKELEELITKSIKSDFEIGTLLYKVRQLGHYEPFTTWHEYIASLNIKISKARYLSDIAEVTANLDIPAEEYEPVGKSKLRHICSLDYKGEWTNPTSGVVTPMAVFIKALIANGVNLTLDDIVSKVKTLKGQTGENSRECMHIWVTTSARKQVIEPAFEEERKKLGSAGKDEEGLAKDYSEGFILEMWAADRLSESGVTNGQTE